MVNSLTFAKNKIKMKKTLLLALVAFSSMALAQNVGVNTNTPTETLDVNGTARVQNLPENGSTGTINTPNANSNFTATKTVVVDDNGVLGTVNVIPSDASKEANQSSVESDGTKLYEPIERCWKGVVGDGTPANADGHIGTMTFEESGYKFAWKDYGAGKVVVNVKRTPKYATDSRRAKSTWSFSQNDLYGGVAGDFNITDSYKRVFDQSFTTSTTSRTFLIIEGSAQTFDISTVTLNPAGNSQIEGGNHVKVMNICIKQTVL